MDKPDPTYPETLRLLEDVSFALGYLQDDPHARPARERLEAARTRLAEHLASELKGRFSMWLP